MLIGKILEMKPLLPIIALASLILPSSAFAKKPVYYSVGNGLPFSEAVRIGDILYLSGQIGVKPGENKLIDDTMEGQAKQTLDNIGATLKKAGLNYDNVFKCTVMLKDMSEWAAFNKVYVTYFKPDKLPARSAFGSTGLAYNGKLELECMAYFPKGK